jgi:hypothetical protein
MIVIPGHGEDMSATLQQLLSDRLASEVTQTDSEFRKRRYGWLAGRGALRGIHASGEDFDILSINEKIFHEPFRHGTSADISCADEENRFHEGRFACWEWNKRDILSKLWALKIEVNPGMGQIFWINNIPALN